MWRKIAVRATALILFLISLGFSVFGFVVMAVGGYDSDAKSPILGLIVLVAGFYVSAVFFVFFIDGQFSFKANHKK